MKRQEAILLLTVGLATACPTDPPGDEADTSSSETGPSDTGASDTGATDTGSTDTGGESVCGDGLVEGGEECDEGEANADTGTCTSLCKLQICGDGLVGAMEECDDANDDDSDDCANDCTLNLLHLTLAPVKQFEFSWPNAPSADFHRLFERADPGAEWLQVGGDIMGDSLALTVPLHFRASASYELQACTGLECSVVDSLDVEGTLEAAVGHIDNPTGYAHGNGVDISLDGTRLVVSDPTASEDAMWAGLVRVYELTGGEWLEAEILNDPDSIAPMRLFGRAMALAGDGNTLALSSEAQGLVALHLFARTPDPMGVWQEQGELPLDVGGQVAATDDGSQVAVIDGGHVRVFERDVMQNWVQQALLLPEDFGGVTSFGGGLAFAGDGSLAVGATYDSSASSGIGGDMQDTSLYSSGAVYLLERGAMNEWILSAYIKASNPDENDRFGHAVTLSSDGNVLAVGAIGESSQAVGVNGDQNDDTVELSGAVYIFERSQGSWAQVAYVKASNTNYDDRFGSTVSLSSTGNVLAVGAPREASDSVGIGGTQNNACAFTTLGAAYVFRRDLEWAQQAYVKQSDTICQCTTFGETLALDATADTLVVGAPGCPGVIPGQGAYIY